MRSWGRCKDEVRHDNPAGSTVGAGMTITSFDMLFYTVGFLVPGFVWCSMVAMLVPQKGEQSQISFLRFLTFSCVNYALWSWLIFLLIKSEFFTDHAVRSAVAWGLITLISPVVLGLLTGHFSQREMVLRFLRRLGLNPMHPIPTAWSTSSAAPQVRSGFWSL